MKVLTEGQANQVRGLTISGHAIVPRPFVLSGASNAQLNGRFGVNEAVIADAAHELRRVFLTALPSFPNDQIQNGTQATPFDPIVGSDWEQDPVRVAKYNYSSSWLPGQLIVIN